MKQLRLGALLAVALSQCFCGPPPADVSGGWGGLHNLNVTGSETASGHVGITVLQSGGQLSFTLDGCSMKANATGETTFDLQDFECTRRVNQQTWTLQGNDGSITTSPTSFNVSIKGNAGSGDETSTFTWTFNGTRL